MEKRLAKSEPGEEGSLSMSDAPRATSGKQIRLTTLSSCAG
jgi:hypothetical protein